jgi:hypothetical protein
VVKRVYIDTDRTCTVSRQKRVGRQSPDIACGIIVRFRICVPKTTGQAGLGNELIVWAKAYLAAQALDGICVPPAWGLNPRGYRKYFKSGRLDTLRNEALLRLMPSIRFTPDCYFQTGRKDYLDAIKIWAQTCGVAEKPIWSLAAEGMWGGYCAIRRAREFLRQQLLMTRWTLDNLVEYSGLLDPDCLQVALHVRRGDFSPPRAPATYQGKFNLAIPTDWYLNIAKHIQCALGRRKVQFTVVSDGSPSDVIPYKTEINAITTDKQDHRDISDLMILASADVLVCSISAYSLLAAFLSQGLYLWYEPQMSSVNSELYSIWGHENDQKAASSPTQQNLTLAKKDRSAVPRGLPIKANGKLSEKALAMIAAQRRPSFCDLIHYGTVRGAE